MNENNYYIQLFDKIDEIEQIAIQKIKANENLLKLLYYNDGDPLGKPITDEISDEMFGFSGSTDNQKVFFFPSIDRTDDKVTSELRIYTPSFRPDNHIIGVVQICVDLIIHSDLYRIKAGRRLTKMMSETMRALNGQEVSGIGYLKISKKTAITLTKYNRDFWGYRLLFETRAGS